MTRVEIDHLPLPDGAARADLEPEAIAAWLGPLQFEVLLTLTRALDATAREPDDWGPREAAKVVAWELAELQQAAWFSLRFGKTLRLRRSRGVDADEILERLEHLAAVPGDELALAWVRAEIARRTEAAAA